MVTLAVASAAGPVFISSAGNEVLSEGIGGIACPFVLATHDPIVMDAADQILHLRHGALEAETKKRRALSVIDTSGRIQLPPEVLRLFPDRRAVIRMDGSDVRLSPP
ncbi:MAG TPA: hypothetical protein VJ010_02885 [Actinomycetota bacterium]|nr:hypothetical protein [Actinomycetota bacterium]